MPSESTRVGRGGRGRRLCAAARPRSEPSRRPPVPRVRAEGLAPPAPRPYIPPSVRMANEMQMSGPPIWRELSQRSHFSKPSSQWLAKWSVSCKMCNSLRPPGHRARPRLRAGRSFTFRRNARREDPPGSGAGAAARPPRLPPGHGRAEAPGTEGRAPPARRAPPALCAGRNRRDSPCRGARPRLPAPPLPGLPGRERGGEVRGSAPRGPPSRGGLFRRRSLRGRGPGGTAGQEREPRQRVAGARRQFREVWEGLTSSTSRPRTATLRPGTQGPCEGGPGASAVSRHPGSPRPLEGRVPVARPPAQRYRRRQRQPLRPCAHAHPPRALPSHRRLSGSPALSPGVSPSASLRLVKSEFGVCRSRGCH